MLHQLLIRREEKHRHPRKRIHQKKMPKEREDQHQRRKRLKLRD